MIVPILILSDKIIISLSYENLTLWPIYITIGNLDVNIWQSQKLSRTLLLGFIFIIYEQSKDAKNKNQELKAKIYCIALKTILQYTNPCFSFINFKKIKC